MTLKRIIMLSLAAVLLLPLALAGCGNETTTESGESEIEPVESEGETSTKEKAGRRFANPEPPNQALRWLYLYDDGTFFFYVNPFSSRKTAMVGTWRLEGNKIITEARSERGGDEEYLSLEFADESTIIWHTSESSDLTDYMLINGSDLTFSLETDTEVTSG